MEILKWAWWLMPTITKLGKLREEDCYKFKASLDYISNSKWKIKSKKQESFMNSWWYRMEITSTINYLSFKYIYVYIHKYIYWMHDFSTLSWVFLCVPVVLMYVCTHMSTLSFNDIGWILAVLVLYNLPVALRKAWVDRCETECWDHSSWHSV